MPDPNVHVTFDANAEEKFSFDPPEVKMREKGKVIFHKRPGSARWKFKGAAVKDDTLNQFCSSVRGNGQNLHIHDEFLDNVVTAYKYQIMVDLDGRIFESPDPVIVNEPGQEAE